MIGRVRWPIACSSSSRSSRRSAGPTFLYPVELNFSFRRDLIAGQKSIAPGITAAVLEQVRAGRAAILIWNSEPTPFELDSAGRTSVFDRVQALVVDHDLPPSRVWFASGNLLGNHVFTRWIVDRRLYEPEAFRFRALPAMPGMVQARYRASQRG